MLLSAATHDLQGLPRADEMVRKAAERGYRMGGRSVLLTSELCNKADLILTVAETYFVLLQKRG